MLPRVVGKYGAIAILLQAFFALRTVAAGIDKTTNSNVVTNFELADFVADRSDDACDFVSGNHREDAFSPFITNLMYVGVADTAVLDLDQDVVFTRFATFK